MAITALHSASTGLSSLSTELDVIANHLANINTTGFKASRVNFEDLMYQQKQQPGVENANGDLRPAGLYVGLGTKVSNTQIDFTQGDPVSTDHQLDLMIEGHGFFELSIVEDIGGGRAYTRDGNFIRNAEGDLVLGTMDGPRLEPPISIPEDTTKVEITSDGQVFAFTNQDIDGTLVGTITLSTFVNPEGLRSIGGNRYIETAASGPPIQGLPGESQFGTILQNHLESSNVEPVKELISLIKTQRAFEMNSQTIQAADETLQVISNLRRF